MGERKMRFLNSTPLKLKGENNLPTMNDLRHNLHMFANSIQKRTPRVNTVKYVFIDEGNPISVWSGVNYFRLEEENKKGRVNKKRTLKEKAP
jgi:hypothetical protein